MCSITLPQLLAPLPWIWEEQEELPRTPLPALSSIFVTSPQLEEAEEVSLESDCGETEPETVTHCPIGYVYSGNKAYSSLCNSIFSAGGEAYGRVFLCCIMLVVL